MLINNHRLHVEVHGSETGPAVVFLHHGLGSTRAWRSQIPGFIDAGYRVVVYDRWGYGKSEPRPKMDPPEFATDVADLRALLDELEVQQTILIGHSDGGTIALYFAAAYPQRVSAIVVIAAHIHLERETIKPGIGEVLQAYQKDKRFRAGMHRAHGEKADAVMHGWYDGWHNPEVLGWDMRPTLLR